jgi:hypothetical protein
MVANVVDPGMPVTTPLLLYNPPTTKCAGSTTGCIILVISEQDAMPMTLLDVVVPKGVANATGSSIVPCTIDVGVFEGPLVLKRHEDENVTVSPHCVYEPL